MDPSLSLVISLCCTAAPFPSFSIHMWEGGFVFFPPFISLFTILISCPFSPPVVFFTYYQVNNFSPGCFLFDKNGFLPSFLLETMNSSFFRFPCFRTLLERPVQVSVSALRSWSRGDYPSQDGSPFSLQDHLNPFFFVISTPILLALCRCVFS